MTIFNSKNPAECNYSFKFDSLKKVESNASLNQRIKRVYDEKGPTKTHDNKAFLGTVLGVMGAVTLIGGTGGLAAIVFGILGGVTGLGLLTLAVVRQYQNNASLSGLKESKFPFYKSKPQEDEDVLYLRDTMPLVRFKETPEEWPLPPNHLFPERYKMKRESSECECCNSYSQERNNAPLKKAGSHSVRENQKATGEIDSPLELKRIALYSRIKSLETVIEEAQIRSVNHPDEFRGAQLQMRQLMSIPGQVKKLAEQSKIENEIDQAICKINETICLLHQLENIEGYKDDDIKVIISKPVDIEKSALRNCLEIK